MARRTPEALRDAIRDFRRDQVVDSARRLFGERGTVEVPIDEIAQAAGVARSTVYVYFAGRDELLRACLAAMYADVRRTIADAWVDDDPLAQLGAVVHGLLGAIDEHPAFFRLVVATGQTTSGAGEAVGAELSHIGLEMAVVLQDLITAGVSAGVFRPVDPARGAALVGQQLFGAMSVRAGDPAPDPLAVSVAEVTEFLRRGLGAG